MKILLECFIPIESGPIFTIGLAKALIHNGVDVYALLVDNIENLSEWNSILDKNHLCLYQGSVSFKRNPLKKAVDYFKIWNFFKGIKFDFWLDTFPTGTSMKVSHFIKSDESMGIAHDVIPHSSVAEKDSRRTELYLNKFDNLVVLSRSYIPLVMEKYSLTSDHVIYLRHGALEYPIVNRLCESKNTQTTNFLYFGRIDGYKGLHILATAYKKLTEKYNNVTLTIAGSGDFSDYKEEYSSLTNCRIINKYLQDDDIAELFGKKNTIVTLPYIDATQSGVISMALFYEKPVIVSDTGGLREQLFNGEMGIFVKPNDSTDLYNKMECFLQDKMLYEKQTKLMEIGHKKSTWNYCVKEFLDNIKKASTDRDLG